MGRTIRLFLAALVALVAIPVIAAPVTTPVSFVIYTPSGAPITSGTISAELSAAGTTADGASVVQVAAKVTASITGAGFTLNLVPNDRISPANTYYKISVQTSAPVFSQRAELWQVPYSATSLNAGGITRLNLAPGISVGPFAYYVAADPSGACLASDPGRIVVATKHVCVCPPLTLTWDCSAATGQSLTLNGLSGATQTFADVDDTNVGLAVASVGTTHTFTLSWLGRLAFSRFTQGSALSVFGVAGNATADFASIVAATDGGVLRRAGSTVGFGVIDLTNTNTVATNPYARANHSGSQLAATISDFAAAVALTAYTQSQLSTDDGTPPNAGSNRVHWDNLVGVPAGFADGTDDGAGGAPPTGTGFRHITTGAEDAAAKLVDTADVNNGQITYAKIQNVNSTDRILGRSSVGAGVIEEIVCNSVCRAFLAASTQGGEQTALGLGALALLATVGSAQITDGTVALVDMADLAQDQFIGRTTASTGPPQTTTITAPARTVLDDTSVAAMVDTLGGASATGSGGLVRATSPTLVTPALGTPTALVLTNATGLPVAALVGDVPFTNIAQASGASKLLGRGSAAGAGDFQEITLGSGLTMTGTSLSASAGAGDIGSVGDCTTGACFDGTQGTTQTFFNAGGNGTFSYDGTVFNFSKPIAVTQTAAGGSIDLLEATGGSNFLRLQAPTALTSDGTCTLLNVTSRFIPNSCLELIDSGDISNDTITAANLAATLTFGANDLLDFTSTGVAAGKGLILPQHATSCSTATAQGQLCWEIDAKHLWIGDGTNPVDIGPSSGGSSPLTTKGDLFGFTTVAARHAAGTNGQVVGYNSANADGLANLDVVKITESTITIDDMLVYKDVTDGYVNKAFPNNGTNGCAGGGEALQYNRTTHALGCVTGLSSGGGITTLTGDVVAGPGSGSQAATLANVPSGTPHAGSSLFTNIAAPGTPASGKNSVYSDSTDLRFHDKNASGVVGTTVVADAGAANNFLTAISVAGAISKAQPAFSNLSGAATTTQGGTGNAFTKFSGPATSEKTFTLPNANAAVLTDNALVTVAQGGSGAGTLTGVLKGNGTSAFSAATPGTDFTSPSSTETMTNKTLTGPIVTSSTVAGLPAASSNTNKLYIVTDAATAGSCTSGSGSALSLCRSNGTIWQPVGDGGSSSGLSADSVGTSELNDGSDTPAAGEIVAVATGATAFEYLPAVKATTSGEAAGHVLIYKDSTDQYVNHAVSGDATMDANGVLSLTSQLTAMKTSDQTAIGTTYADVTGLGFSLAASTNYQFEYYIIADSDATTTGIDVGMNGPASPTTINYSVTYWTSATVSALRGAIAYQLDTASTASNGTAARIFLIQGTVRNGSNAGTLIPQAKREAVGSGPNVRSGSYGILRRIP